MVALFFDTETTGFKGSRVVQLGALLQDTETGRVISEFNGMVLTEGVEIPQAVIDVHGITNEHADKYGYSMNVVDYIFGRMIQGADLLVAHNIDFDLNIVMTNLPKSAELIKDKQQYCTMLNAVDLVGIKKSHGGGNKWPKLIETYRYFFDKDFDGAHDAMIDVRACRDVYFALQAHV